MVTPLITIRGCMTDNKLLRMENIRKEFSGVLALDGLNFELHRGEVHGLLGENGAGKSTLINVLGGIYHPNGGEIFIAGEKVNITDVATAEKFGIGIIHQELSLVPHMTIAENIFLGHELLTKYGTINKKRMEEKVKNLFEMVGIDFSVNTPVKQLSVAQQQMVEIAKTFSLNAKILVMDEPTSSLTEKEIVQLFRTIKILKKEGVGVVFISHKLNELFEITDRITVIRDGKYVGTANTRDIDTNSLIHMMVGRNLEQYYARTEHPIGDTVLRAENLTRKKYFSNISFEVRAGEVVGFSGLVGAGRSELFKSIVGFDPRDDGHVFIENTEIKKQNPNYSKQCGLVMVPEDRKEEGLILINSVGFNLTLTVLDKFIKLIYVSKKKESEIEDQFIDRLKIKTPHKWQDVNKLSGGNQQKVLIGKWLATNPRVLIFDEPTRGVDVGAKAEIYKIIDELAQSGIAIVIISSEMMEIINMCDRIMVMHHGEIFGEFEKNEFSQDEIMRCATGSKRS
jgi:ribose transport system ATP-binding protein/inositol transport system ATP-binding protein